MYLYNIMYLLTQAREIAGFHMADQQKKSGNKKPIVESEHGLTGAVNTDGRRPNWYLYIHYV